MDAPPATPEPPVLQQPLESFGASSRRRPPVRWGKVLLAAMVALIVLAVAGGVVSLQLEKEPVVPVTHHSLHFTQGQTLRYGIDGSMDMSVTSREAKLSERIHGTSSAIVSMKVMSVDRDRVARIAVTTERGSTSVGGKAVPLPRRTETIRLTRGGRISPAQQGGDPDVEFSALAVGPFDLFSPHLPARPVGKGDRWSRTYRVVMPGGSTVKVVTKSRFLRYEEVQGVRAAVVRTTVTIPFSVAGRYSKISAALGGSPGDLRGIDPKVEVTARVTGAVTGWFDQRGGTLLKSFGTSVFNGTYDFDGTAFTRDPGLVRFTGRARVGVIKLS